MNATAPSAKLAIASLTGAQCVRVRVEHAGKQDLVEHYWVKSRQRSDLP